MKPLRFVTAASLFDGHDVSVNIMRRILQSKGVEVIHLGHNRSAKEVVDAAIMEDAHGVALSSYQGGHNEYFLYIRKLLDEQGAQRVKIFGGGGGVITPTEKNHLESHGIERIYTPKDGMELGLEGLVQDMIDRATYVTYDQFDFKKVDFSKITHTELSKVLSYVEDKGEIPKGLKVKPHADIPVLGITGTGGAGKSSLIDELLLRFHLYLPQLKVALLSIDPTKKSSKGALLGDRIRLGSAALSEYFIRSSATRDSKNELAPHTKLMIDCLQASLFDLVIVETSGIGQVSDEITTLANQCIYVMTPEYGAQTQLEKITMLEEADFIVLNKFEKMRSEDALRDIRKQYRRNHQLFSHDENGDEALPIYGTMASHFNDPGVNGLFVDVAKKLNFSIQKDVLENIQCLKVTKKNQIIVPSERIFYLREIASTVRSYNKKVQEEAQTLKKIDALTESLSLVEEEKTKEELLAKKNSLEESLPDYIAGELELFNKTVEMYNAGTYSYEVRGKKFELKTKIPSLAGLDIPRVACPQLSSSSEKYKFIKFENLPGHFPFASGLFPFRRRDEDPKRQFAGEGGPHRTNERFHFLCKNDPAKRLSTAFDSVTLYGEDPDERPDIYGKVGESGVSICSLQDMEDLYAGFDLTDPSTSVSMTINGPAPIILAMYMNAAIKQKLGPKDFWNQEKRLEIIRQVRGTVQADILKEDQAQNTCIFSLEMALKMMGDVQEFFCQNHIKKYYSVSISGYHIAEAGANPITQLALTLANGFTYVEYYLSRGMNISDFAENLSFFFSNGLDSEYAVMGKVARKIWSVVMRDKYKANIKSQKLKYHIQTSGRSLHAQEIDFNDIRTTLQALIALADQCNSLHTNAYDEAITTPTAESVRRAMAIQLIVDKEFGLMKTENPFQGSYIISELTELVEEAVLQEFERISDKGGVLGAMESMYQRSKIQDESLYYESLKDTGKLPIIGVNTYLAENIHELLDQEIEITRADTKEKDNQIKRLRKFQEKNKDKSTEALDKLKEVVLAGGNIFEELLHTVNFCSLGEITNLLFKVGGKYRRNM